MSVLGPRPLGGKVLIVGRPPNDYARELQDKLDKLDDLGTVINTVLSTMTIEAGGGTVTVTMEADGGWARTFLLMGA